ncbi:hypothetical protein JYT71_00500 [Acidimicrobiaceae bacterium AH-315-P05]|nr:hypothetical protein [Acidimicrobiaceae bacterium AH-315-P05]
MDYVFLVSGVALMGVVLALHRAQSKTHNLRHYWLAFGVGLTVIVVNGFTADLPEGRVFFAVLFVITLRGAKKHAADGAGADADNPP